MFSALDSAHDARNESKCRNWQGLFFPILAIARVPVLSASHLVMINRPTFMVFFFFFAFRKDLFQSQVGLRWRVSYPAS
jgi:hypothetical protein